MRVICMCCGQFVVVSQSVFRVFVLLNTFLRAPLAPALSPPSLRVPATGPHLPPPSLSVRAEGPHRHRRCGPEACTFQHLHLGWSQGVRTGTGSAGAGPHRRCRCEHRVWRGFRRSYVPPTESFPTPCRSSSSSYGLAVCRFSPSTNLPLTLAFAPMCSINSGNSNAR